MFKVGDRFRPKERFWKVNQYCINEKTLFTIRETIGFLCVEYTLSFIREDNGRVDSYSGLTEREVLANFMLIEDSLKYVDKDYYQ